jgi:two-component system, NarL family, sensor kinase
VAAQEAERRRLARDIHDGISQRLVSLWYHLDAALTHLDRDDPGPARTAIEVAGGLVDTTLEEARAAIGALRPPVLDDLGLAGALAALARGIPGVEGSLDLDERRLPDHVEIALYRIAQEALQNVQKHAGARRVTLRLAIGAAGVRLAIDDDGVGFSPADVGPPDDTGGFGLASVRERAELIGGTVRLSARPGEGTTLAVTAPLPGGLDVSVNGEESARNT